MEAVLTVAKSDGLSVVSIPGDEYVDLSVPNRSFNFEDGDDDGMCISFTYKGLPALKNQFGKTKLLLNIDLLRSNGDLVHNNKFSKFLYYAVEKGVTSHMAFTIGNYIKDRDDPLWDRLLVTGSDFSAALIIAIDTEEISKVIPVFAPMSNEMDIFLSMKPDDTSIDSHVARLRALEPGPDSLISVMYKDGWKNAKVTSIHLPGNSKKCLM